MSSKPIAILVEDDELQRCIRTIIDLQGKGTFWREVTGIQSGEVIS